MYGNTCAWFRLKIDNRQANIDNMQTMDDKPKNTIVVDGFRIPTVPFHHAREQPGVSATAVALGNPQDDKNKISVGNMVVLDWWTSTTKQSGIICSRCSKNKKDKKDVPMHQQLWQWGSEWLCSECWNRANESKESEDQPAAKKAKHSSWD